VSVDLGTWCLMSAPYGVTAEETGRNNYFFASQKCAELGGYLPTAAQLVGAAPLVKLTGTIGDNATTANVDEDPTDGTRDRREMSSTLVTTAAGSRAAGSQGVSEGSRGDPPAGRARPAAAARQPVARHAPVPDGLRQRRQGRLRRIAAGVRARELPLRVRQAAGGGAGGGTRGLGGLAHLPHRLGLP
jgi:hypothetical protein